MSVSGIGAVQRLAWGHPGAVWSVAFAPDGRYLASGSVWGTIELWNAVTFARIALLKGGAGQIRSLALTGAGRFLAAATHAAPMIVWDFDLLR